MHIAATAGPFVLFWQLHFYTWLDDGGVLISGI